MTTAEIQLNDPQTLYRRWEDSQWSPFAIDLASDKGQWREMTGEERELVYFVLSSVTRFIVNVQPGRFTEVVCLFDVCERGRDAAGWARSLHVFTAA